MKKNSEKKKRRRKPPSGEKRNVERKFPRKLEADCRNYWIEKEPKCCKN